MAVKAKYIPIPDLVKPGRALLSVSDKTGIVELAEALLTHGIELVSTGGTRKAIEAAGLPVVDVASLTGFPEIMDGRVKTLHPAVHGGLLAIRNDDDHAKAMADHDIAPIDIAIINLYPFEETVASDADAQTIVENIDIGGPAMIRASAKNHAYVTIVTAPSDYAAMVEELSANDGATRLAFREQMAARAFAHTARYDAAIANWFADQQAEPFPHTFAIAAERMETLRYGENPHQQAAVYRTGQKRIGVTTAIQIQGKALSYNNINDTDAAYELVSELGTDQPAVAIIKHANPCGVATGKTLAEACRKAYACDTVSAFGGIVALNGELDAEAAKEIVKIFTEVIIAPSASDEAKSIIGEKKNLRLLLAGGLPDPQEEGMIVKSIGGGLLLQSRDAGRVALSDLKTVTKRAPTQRELEDMLFAFRVAKHVKSNAIIYVKDGATVGIGAGQMSRVDSSRIAACKAQDAADQSGAGTSATKGSVVASDAFFPFADGLLAAVEAGATAVIQPGGSMRDEEVIAAADEAGIAMVFTGMRHFRH